MNEPRILVLSQPDTMDVSYSAVKAEVGKELADMPEVESISGMLQGLVQTLAELGVPWSRLSYEYFSL